MIKQQGVFVTTKCQVGLESFFLLFNEVIILKHPQYFNGLTI